MFFSTTTSLLPILTLLLAPPTTAHFTLDWPTARGFDDAQATSFPCGGFNNVKTPRTDFPLSGGPLQLNMHHPRTRVAVYLALGNDPGSSFNYVLLPQLTQTGLGDFCLGHVNLPSGVNVTAGTNATIQVVTNGDPDGGLYQCADVTFTNAALSESHCNNNTNVKVVTENMQGNPNASASGTGTTSGSPSPSPSNAAAHVTAAGWLLGAVGAAGMALL
ncbi:hypothetical protein DM02DRAFT_532140 [Periconia macrospinosa]|uniref:Copper acquisition factor BIM1-like domain-containing protein n=1 Tax=Periconia macrospinosa TaxID=97972 RepID=A0A2V1DIQ6_9PLEO|nr:hypothetical protein DM02DRAFT_532140 [Periconia macrospinosa]